MDRTIANTRNLKAAGFSLVEILVGLFIGLLATLVIMQTFSSFEGQKRTTTSGSDAQTNGALALYSIERDVRMAGYGLGVAAALGCKINTYYNGTLASFSLVPITITNGASNTPDSIQILSSSKTSFSVPASITVNHPPQATNFFINSTAGMQTGDILVAFEAGKDCTMLQVTGIPAGNIQIHHQNTSPWNPPGGQNIFPQPSGYNIGATLFNLGGMINRIYSISNTPAGGLLLTTFNSANNTSSTVTIIPHIINMQILYGKDTNADGNVDTYDNTTPTTSAGWQQVQAVKMALVARSTQWEKAIVTTSATFPWSGAAFAPLHVDQNPDGTANADWQHYRYKIFETVIPLRNMIWKQ